MATKSNLDDISTAIERTVKALRGDVAPATKRMPLREFVTFALGEIQKAARDTPELAKRRLTTLKRNVDKAIAAISKMAAEDTDSEDIHVEVTTAFAPTKAQGDTPMEDLTTSSDQSSTEMPLASASSASGDSAFAENLGEVAKALRHLKDDLEATSNDARPRATKQGRAASDRGSGGSARGDRAGGAGDRDADRPRGAGGDRDEDGWPLDLASATFLKDGAGDDAEPLWGYDPDEVAAPKVR